MSTASDVRYVDNSSVLQGLDDFNHFCSTLDSGSLVASTDESGCAKDYEKKVYASAILRAVQNGDFGEEKNLKQAAISALWERGYRSGFNVDSFNAVFQEYFSGW